MTVLSTIQDAARILGINVPSAVVSSTDTDTLQLLGLFNQAGRELASLYGWQILTREVTFTTVATESQGTLASIISTNDSGHDIRYIVNDTIWNRSQRFQVWGPRAHRDWQALKSFNVTGPYPEYRIRAGELLFNPVPAAGDTCAFEYVDKHWLTNSGGTTYYSAANADTDVALLSEELLLASLRWRWRAAKKLDYQDEKNSYDMLVLDATARDGTKRIINMDYNDRLGQGAYAVQGGVGSGSSSSGGIWSPPGWS